MLHHLPHVLTAQHLKRVQSLLDQAEFVDGRLSAGQLAKSVKNNLELNASPNLVNELNELVMGQLVRHGLYQRAAFALKVAAPLFIKYAEGMTYGSHVDNPVMGHGQLYRCDIAVTVFLNDDYEGGELVMETPFGENRVKLPAGDAIMYPASSIHRVEPVTSGARLAAVTWLQSMIRDPAQRQVLVDISEVRDKLMARDDQAAEARKLDHAYVNLVRRWAEL